MPILRPTRQAPAGAAAPPKPRRFKAFHLAAAIQLLTLAAAGAVLMRSPSDPPAAPAEPPTRRVRYEVKQEEWPARPTLRQIQDRYGGNLAAMQSANERGACADPDSPIDYGETIFIDFSSNAGACVPPGGGVPGS